MKSCKSGLSLWERPPGGRVRVSGFAKTCDPHPALSQRERDPQFRVIMLVAVAAVLAGCMRGQVDGSWPAKNINLIGVPVGAADAQQFTELVHLLDPSSEIAIVIHRAELYICLTHEATRAL